MNEGHTNDRVVYLFGITRSDLEIPGLPPLPAGGRVRSVADAGLRAVVCDVNTATLASLVDPDQGSFRLLADTARAHDEALAALATLGPVLPLRIGVTVVDDHAVRDLLRRHTDALRAELDRLDGHAEWAAVVHVDETESGPPPPRASPTTGRDYLEQRRADRDARNERAQRRETLATVIHRVLAEQAVAADRVDGRRFGEAPPPLLHGVYLVPDDGRARFARSVGDVQAAHPQASIELTGPWPAYHFTSVVLEPGRETNA